MMLTLIAAALAAAQSPAPAPATASAPHAQHAQPGQMDHSKMDHSQMSGHCEACCKKMAEGKMDCARPKQSGAQSDHQGHSGI